MKKGLRVFINILESIIGLILGLLGAICLIPFAIIYLLLAVPVEIIGDIWIEPSGEIKK